MKSFQKEATINTETYREYKNGKLVLEYTKDGFNKYDYDNGGNLIRIVDSTGQRIWGKKIYTVDEAMKATEQGDKFHVSLTYK